MVYLAALFFAVLIYAQGNPLRQRRQGRDLAAFLLITLLAASYSLGQLLGAPFYNPADTINFLLQPLIDLFFGEAGRSAVLILC